MDSPVPQRIYHPYHPEKKCLLEGYSYENIIGKVMDKGRKLTTRSMGELAKYASERLKQVPAESKRFDNPHIYKVGIGNELIDLRNNLKDNIWKR
jgi:nicotinate phosphoribosyltransferase